MTVETQVVRFVKDATDVDSATQDVALNFTPKAIIVFSDCNTADNTASAHYQWSQGFSDGTTHQCIVITSEAADTAADTQTMHSDSIYARMLETSNATVEERATCTFGTNKVTFTWVTNSADATLITIWAIGGTDITNVKVGNSQVNRTGTGTVDYTGLGFNPSDGNSVLFTLGTFFSATVNISAQGATSHFGCAVSASKEWCIANVMVDTADPTDTWRVTYNDKTIVNLGAVTAVEDWAAEFSAWITDGFRLNYTNGPEFSTYLFSYLVINGGTWDAGTLVAPTTATNNVDYPVSLGSKTPRGLLINGAADIGSGSIDSQAIISVGATDGTNQSVIGMIDLTTQATSDSFRINNTTQIVKKIVGAGADNDVAAFDSFSIDNFRLDWTTKSAAAQLCNWVVVADSTSAGTGTGQMNFTVGSSVGVFH